MDNNVQARIDDYLDQLFGPYEDSPSAAELRIEVRHDLLERLNDLTGRGVGDEVAYAQVISAVGDLGAMIEDLAAQDRAEKTGSTGSGGAAGAGDTPGTAPVSDDPRDRTQPEPNGPADSIQGCPTRDDATGGAPGVTWQAAGEGAQPDPYGPSVQAGEYGTGAQPGPYGLYDDIAASVAGSVAAGLEAARTQFADAWRQIEDAFTQAGLADPTRRARQDWERRSERAERRYERRYARPERRTRVSFAATDLRGGNFRGQDLSGSSFAASSMRSVDFTGAVLQGSSLASSDLRDADFSQADLTGANLSACGLRGARFDRTNLSGANLSVSDLRSVVFTGATLTGAKAAYADVRAAEFRDCRLDGADFRGSDLRGATFDALALTDVRFDMANLTNASFRGSTLHGVSFHHVSRKVIASVVFQDTVVDQVTAMSLRSNGATLEGIRVED